MKRHRLSIRARAGTATVALLALAACVNLDGAAPAQPLSCANAAAAVAAGSAVPGARIRITLAEAQSATPTLKAHCLVEGAINERVSTVDGTPYAIKFRMRLPQAADWNGKFFQESVGGSVGTLTQVVGLTSGMTTSAFSRGYTVIMGDSGHDTLVNTDPNAGGASAFARDPQARVDFGHASYDLVAQVGKALSRAYYAKAPNRAYFSACSDGGRQAVGIAQRYPQHFDGILAAAPAVDIPHMTAYVPLILQTLGPLAKAGGHIDANGRPLINKVYSNADLQLVSSAVLQACDAQDGLKDGIVNHIDACTDAVVHPQLHALACGGEKTAACLSRPQIAAFKTLMAGPKDSSGRQVYPGHAWDPGIGGMNVGKSGDPFNNGFRAFWFGNFDAPTNTATKVTLSAPQAAMLWKTPPLALPTAQYIDHFMAYNIDDTEASITRKTAAHPQAVVDWGLMNSPDLSAFKQRGGKMIAWIGNADPAVSPKDTIRWFKSVHAHEAARGGDKDGSKAADFLRLFVVPGMNHCAGGVATDRFDMLTPLEDWVERGIAPASVPAEASNPGYFGVASRSRPLCPYPQYAHYNGSGDINIASSFGCRQPPSLTP